MRRMISFCMMCLLSAAIYAQQTYTLTVKQQPKGIGTITISTGGRLYSTGISGATKQQGNVLQIEPGTLVSMNVSRDVNFNGWEVDGWMQEQGSTVVSYMNSSYPFWYFTMPAEDVTLTAKWEYNPNSPGHAPGGNNWNPETGEVILTDITANDNYLSSMLSNVVSDYSSNKDKVYRLTIIGVISNDFMSLSSYYVPEFLVYLDYSRTSKCTEVKKSPLTNNHQFLKEVRLPASITSIQRDAFTGTDLQTLTCFATTPPTLSFQNNQQKVFNEGSQMIVYVPEESVPLYKNAAGWGDFQILPLSETVRNLTVNLFPDGATAELLNLYKGMKLELIDQKAGITRNLLITNRNDYTFRTVPTKAAYQVRLLNRNGSVVGEINNIYVDEDHVSVTFPSLLTPREAQIALKYENGDPVDSKDAEVTWLSATGSYLGNKTSISGLVDGEEVMCRIKLASSLSDDYQQVDTVKHTIGADNHLVYTLRELPQHMLSGTVFDDLTSNRVSGYTVRVNRLQNGGSSNAISVKSADDGTWSAYLRDGRYDVTVSHGNYAPQTKTVDISADTKLNFMLQPNRGSIIALNLRYHQMATETEPAKTINFNDQSDNVDITIRNLTSETDITGFSVQNGNIQLTDTLAIGTQIQVTITSKTRLFAPASATGTMQKGEGGLHMDIDLVQNGRIVATFSETQNPKVGGLLFNSQGTLVSRDEYTWAKLSLMNLTAGEYVLITMQGNSEIFTSLNTLEQARKLLTAGVDYLENTVEVKAGEETTITNQLVPMVRESVQLYTVAENSMVTVNKKTLIAGNYQTIRARIELRPEYHDGYSNMKMQFVIPEGCTFVENSVMQGATASPYEYDTTSGILTVPMIDESQIVRFCVVPMTDNTYRTSATLWFDYNKQTLSQSVATEEFETEKANLNVNEKITEPVFLVSGTCIPNLNITVKDGNTVIGTTKSKKDGSWSLECEIQEPVALSVHQIYAEIQLKEGIIQTTERRMVTYAPDEIKPLRITFSHYNDWYHKDQEIVLDLENHTRSGNSYPIYHGGDFTFQVELSNNDPSVVHYVDIYVFTSDGGYTVLPAKYDATIDRWVANQYFTNMGAPINASVRVVADAPARMDADFHDTMANYYDNMKKEDAEYQLEVNKVSNELDELTDKESYTAEDLTQIMAHWTQLMDKLGLSEGMIQRAKEKYGDSYDPENPDPENPECPGFVDDGRYTNDEAGMEKWIADTQAAMDEFDLWYAESQIDQMSLIDINPKPLHEVGELLKGITYSTADGLTDSQLLAQGYEKLDKDDGTCVYIYYGETSYTLVDLVNNLKMVADASQNTEMARMMQSFKAAGGDDFVSKVSGWINQLMGYVDKLLQGVNELCKWAGIVNDEVNAAQELAANKVESLANQTYHLKGKDWVNSKLARKTMIDSRAKLKKVENQLTALNKVKDKLEKLKVGKILKVTGVIFSIYNAATGMRDFAEMLGNAVELYQSIPDPCEGPDASKATTLKVKIATATTAKATHSIMKIGTDVVAFCTTVAGLIGVTSVFAAPEGGVAIGAAIGGELLNLGIDWVVDKLYKNNIDYWAKEVKELECVCKDPNKCCKGPKCCLHGPCDVPPGIKPNIVPILDPSGYVYEAVGSNRIEGVKSTIYYKEAKEDIFGNVTEEAIVWDAENYAQENPLFTDEQGMYAWDVPQGQWQVRFEKEGYESTQTEWLPVPPPQLDINIGMKQYSQPTVAKVKAYEKEVQLTFDKYMKPKTLKAENLHLIKDGVELAATIELLNAENDVDGDSAVYASRLSIVPEQPMQKGEKVRLIVAAAVESYAGVNMAEDFSQEFDVEACIDTLMADSLYTVRYGSNRSIVIAAAPAEVAVGKTLKVQSNTKTIADVSATELIFDAEGKVTIEVNGLLPGTAGLLLQMDDYDIEKYVVINVRDSAGIYTKAPEASRVPGTEVYYGTHIYLTTETPDAKIYYSLDGTCPCDMTIGHVFPYDPKEGIVINADNMKIKAMAVANDYEESKVSEFEYRLKKSTMAYDLQKGWNWVSHNQANDVEASEVLKSGDDYLTDGKGTRTLTMEPAKAYLAFSNNKQTSVLTGNLWNAAEGSMTLAAGWNWLGYPMNQVMTPDEALLGAEEGDMIVGQEAFAEFVEGKWRGSLRVLVPGKGYHYKSASAKTIHLNNNIVSEAAQIDHTMEVLWAPNMHRYAYNMPITAILLDGGVELGDDYVVGAFNVDGYDCLGESQWVDGRLLIPVSGEKNMEVLLLAYHKNSQKYFDVNEAFVFADDNKGTRLNPEHLTLGGENTGINTPLFHVVNSDRLFDLQGRKMSHRAAGKKVAKGIYVSDGRKIVIK